MFINNLLKKPIKFSPVSQKEDTEGLLPSPSSNSFPLEELPRQNRWKTRSVVIWIILIGSILAAFFGFWSGFRWMGRHLVMDSDRFCIKHISQYSPVVDEVNPNWQTIRFNGSLLRANAYRGPAGPETDAAWAALGVDYRSIVVPQEEAGKTGLLPDQVKISQKYGGGYPANVEGLHHLHCLNLMRKALYWNYDYYHGRKEGSFVNSDYVIRYHVTHCMDVLRQQLMCTLDVGVLGQVWYQLENMDKPQPYVDFMTNHKCRDFEAVRKWAEAHQLPPESEVDMSQFYEQPKPGDKIYSELP